MGSSRVEQALNELDPGSRAVVDLSLGTDFSDENIATLIRVEPDEVARRRERAIDALQQKLDGASHDEVVLELCAAMGVAPPGAMLEGDARNGSSAGAAPINGSTAPVEEREETEASEPQSPAATGDAVREDFEEPAEDELDSGLAAPVPADDVDAVHDDSPAGAESPVANEAEFAETETPEGLEEIEATDVGARDESAAAAVPPGDAPETEIRSERDSAPPFIPPPRETASRDATDGGSRRRTGAVIAALAAGLIVVGGVVALSGGGESDSGGPEPQSPASESPSESSSSGAASGVSASLEPLPDAPAGAEAEVTLDGDRLTVELDGLPAPRGTYEAWLFTSVLDSRQLGSIDSGSGTIRADLPESADRFEYLDISIQPSGSPQHSGRSIFRVPVADLVG